MLKTRITKKDIERFTRGDCHILATAIHKLTGWSLYAFENSSTGLGEGHAFVMPEPYIFLDITGLSTYEEMQKKWFWYTSYPIIEIDLQQLYSWDGPIYGEYSFKRASVVAKHLVKEYLKR